MRTSRWSLLFSSGLLGTALLGAGCEDRQVAVFSVDGVPEKTSSLGVYSRLNSGTLLPGSVRQNVSEFGIELPIDTTGTITTQVFAYANDVPCILGQGSASVDMPGKYRQNATVTMTPQVGSCKTGLEPVDFPNKPAVWASAPDDMWLAGQAGKIVHWNGSYYEQIPLPNALQALSPDWTAVYGWSADDVWFAGSKGIVAHYTKGTVTQIQTVWGLSTPAFDNEWRAMTGGDPAAKDLYLVGTNGVYGYLAKNAQVVTRYPLYCSDQALPSSLMNSVSCFVNGTGAQRYYDCWVAGNAGALFRFDLRVPGYNCSGQANPAITPQNLTGVWVSANLTAKRLEVRAVGAGSTILRGTATYAPPALPAVDFSTAIYSGYLTSDQLNGFTGISATGFDNVWITGKQGTLLRWLDTEINPGSVKPFILTSTGQTDDLASVSAIPDGVYFTTTTKNFAYAGSLF